MDDFYFMSPLEGATNNANDRPSTRPASQQSTTTAGESSTTPSSRTSWSSWGVSFNKLIERGKKDMNEFVDVTRKDLTELVHTVQQEHSTAIESLTKKVGDLKTTLPPLPASVNTTSADILGRVSNVVGGIRQEITEAATGVSSNAHATPTVGAEDSTKESSTEAKEGKAEGDSKDTTDIATAQISSVKGITDPAATAASANTPSDSTTAADATSTLTDTTQASPTTTTGSTTARGEKTASLSFASTANLFSAGATSLTQTLTSSTKEISSTANELFKKKLPAVAEKHLGEADLFLKSTTETLKTNGLLAEQYVNKFGAGMVNFLNSAVVISAPEEKEVAARSKKMFFDRKAAMLEKLRMDPATYTVDPMTTIADNDIVGLERYKYFLQTFNMAEYQQRISRLMNEYPEVADEELFWQRYHFRLYEIEEEEKRRQKLVQEAGADLADEDFTWDDNDEDEDEQKAESSGGQGSITPKADKKNTDAMTPRASQILSGVDSLEVKREPLTAEALASSLSALAIPDETTAGSDDGAKAGPGSGSDYEEWGSESMKSSSSPSVKSFSAKSSTGAHSKSPTTNLSSTRTSEDAYEVVDGVETPVRAPMASVTSVSSAASSPALGQSAQQPSSKQKSSETREEDDWSDWE
ncbi:hypothetical protein BGZ54_007009 [Gamsiella multidivaricata]|nr:hypothetical protein BGZ54_007009 [Gamsiella multidivaricata]